MWRAQLRRPWAAKQSCIQVSLETNAELPRLGVHGVRVWLTVSVGAALETCARWSHHPVWSRTGAGASARWLLLMVMLARSSSGAEWAVSDRRAAGGRGAAASLVMPLPRSAGQLCSSTVAWSQASTPRSLPQPRGPLARMSLWPVVGATASYHGTRERAGTHR